MEFISINKAAKKLKTAKENVKLFMMRGELKYKQIGSRWVTTDEWLSEIVPDNVPKKMIMPELNHEFFSSKKKA